MAVAAVQRVAKGLNGASVSITSADGWSAPAAGNLIVISANSDATVTLNAPSGTSAGPSVVDGNGTYTWYKFATGAETAITATPSASDHITLTVCEYSGVQAFDAQNSATAASSQATSTPSVSVTTTQAGDLVLFFGLIHNMSSGLPDPATPSWTNGVTQVLYGGSNTGASTALAAYSFAGELIAGAAGAYSSVVTWTLLAASGSSANAGDRQALVLAFKAAPDAAMPPIPASYWTPPGAFIAPNGRMWTFPEITASTAAASTSPAAEATAVTVAASDAAASTAVNAGQPSVAATSQDASAAATANAEQPGVTVSALDGQAAAGVNAEQPAVSAAAADAAPSVAPNAESTAVTAVAYDATVTALSQLTSTLTDTFTGGTLDAKWSASFGTVGQSGGRGYVESGSGYPALRTSDAYHFDSFFLQVWPASQNGATTEASTGVLIQSPGQPGGTDAGFVFDGINGIVSMRNRVGYGDGGAVDIPFTPGTFVRLRVSAGNLLWDTSPDGQTWTNQRSTTAPSWLLAANDCRIQLEAYRSDGTPNVSEFDNLNTPAVSAPAESTSATATAYDATVSTASATNAPAEATAVTVSAGSAQAAMAANAEQPGVAAAAQVAAAAVAANAGQPGVATTAPDASTASAANAEATAVAVAAQDAAVALSATAEQAPVTTTAYDATITSSANVPAESTAVAVSAYDATVSTSSNVNAPADVAPVAADAQDASAALTVAAGTTTTAVSAQDAVSGAGALPAAATAAVTASDASPAIAVPAGQPSALVAASDASVTATASAEQASVGVIAYDATVSTLANVSAPAEATAVAVSAADISADIRPAADAALVAATSQDATVRMDIPGDIAPVTVAAYDAAASMGTAAPAGTATASAAAFDASVAVRAAVELAQVGVTAFAAQTVATSDVRPFFVSDSTVRVSAAGDPGSTAATERDATTRAGSRDSVVTVTAEREGGRVVVSSRE